MSKDRGQRSAVGDQIGESRQEFFTPRREGAKKTYGSKDRISFLNLSGFASLREIAATHSRPAFARGYSESVREQRGLARAGLHSKPAEEER
jgi:hypothetical protein